METQPNYKYPIPENLYQQFMSDGATQVTAELNTYNDTGSNAAEYEVVARAKFASKDDVLVTVCPRPCGTMNK